MAGGVEGPAVKCLVRPPSKFRPSLTGSMLFLSMGQGQMTLAEDGCGVGGSRPADQHALVQFQLVLFQDKK